MKRLLPAQVAGMLLLAAVFQSCEHDKDNGPSTVKKWNVDIKAIYEVPAPAGRNEEGEATIELLNKTLRALAPGGVIYFSTNYRKFELDKGSIDTPEIKDITRATTPFDFEGKLFRYCFKLKK